ncbi:MAG TPA: hypothetical protein VI258_13755 [Rhodanobacteraceae bacterium]
MRTSLYSILCILIRLGAVLMAVAIVGAIPSAWFVARAQHVEGYGGALFGFSALTLSLAALLWIYPGVLARIAAGKASEQIFESPISAEELQWIAFSLAGIWLVIEAISSLIGSGASAVVVSYMSEDNVPIRALIRGELPRFAVPLVKLVLGIALTLGSRGLVGWLRALRERGPSGAVEGEASPASRDTEAR